MVARTIQAYSGGGGNTIIGDKITTSMTRKSTAGVYRQQVTDYVDEPTMAGATLVGFIGCTNSAIMTFLNFVSLPSASTGYLGYLFYYDMGGGSTGSVSFDIYPIFKKN